MTQSCAELAAERNSLNETLEELHDDQREHKRRAEQQVNEVLRELAARERQVSDLERLLRDMTHKHEQRQVEVERLGDELLRARIEVQRHHDERADLLTRVGRIELRERVLVEQLTILKGELQQTRDPREALDRLVETVTQEARHEADMTLKQARAQADQIVRSAEKRGRELEEAVELRTSEDLQRHLGEALWTSHRSSTQGGHASDDDR